MNYIYKISLIIVFGIICKQSSAQNIVNTKSSIKQQDSAYLKHPLKDAQIKLKQDIKKSWNKAFIQFAHNNLFLIQGMNLSNQNINTGNYESNFNYDVNNYNKNAFKPGYFAGLRWDGKFKEKHDYSIAVNLSKISSGTGYENTGSLSPFLGNFSKFKADDQFFTLSIAAHFKKIIAIGDTSKRKFYFVLGPSMETRLSEQTDDNLVNHNYHRFIIRGDIGLEFDNHSYYTLFLHYKQGISSFTKTPIQTTLNTIELGMMIKASDLF